MAQILAGLLSIPLKEVGKSIGLSLVSKTTAKIFDLVTGDGSEEFKAELHQISIELNKINENITNLNKKITDMRLGIKTDLVQACINEIDTQYSQYMAALQALAQAAADSTAPPSGKGSAKESRRRVADLGQAASNSIYINAEQMHVFLVGQEKASLFYLSHQQSLPDTKDFIAHFVKMKTFLIAMYTPQLKALELMQYAISDSEVHFPEGQKLVDDIEGHITAHEKFWTNVLSEAVVNLAVRLIKNPTDAVPINFAWADKAGIYTGGENSSLYLVDDTKSHLWKLEPVSEVDTRKLDVETPFRLREDQTGHTLLGSPIFEGSGGESWGFLRRAMGLPEHRRRSVPITTG